MAEQKFAAERAHAQKIACGRDPSEQIADIERYGSHGASPVLRAGVLAAHGIVSPRDKAENGVIFGCYRPFTTPFLLRDYQRILDILGLDYTFFEREYCCGLPLVMQGGPEEIQSNLAAGLAFNQKNLELARTKGVSRLAYCCVGCAYTARHHFPREPQEHVYILDLIFEALRDVNLRLKTPQTIAYFEGCHSYYQDIFPEVALNWPAYRQGLDRIECLKVVDLPHKLCCKRAAAKLVDKAEEAGLDKIVCSCNGCYAGLKAASQGRAEVLTLAELLLLALD